MEENKRALISNIIALVLFVVLLNVDSLIIKDESGLIVFRGSYIAIYLILFIYSISSAQKTGYIPSIFDPILKRSDDFPDNKVLIIGVHIAIALILIFAFAFFIAVYVYD